MSVTLAVWQLAQLRPSMSCIQSFCPAAALKGPAPGLDSFAAACQCAQRSVAGFALYCWRRFQRWEISSKVEIATMGKGDFLIRFANLVNLFIGHSF